MIERQSDRERRTDREKGEIAHPLVQLPNGNNSWVWIRVMLDVWNSNKDSHVGDRDSGT